MVFLGASASWVSKAYILAALTTCPAAGKLPDLKVNFISDKPTYNQQYSTEALKQKLGNDRDSTFATDRRRSVHGVTSSTLGHQFKMGFRTLTDERGMLCLYVDHVSLIIKYTPRIFIANNIVNKQCTYGVTRRHEEKHVSIDNRAIRQYLPHISRDMRYYLHSMGTRGFGPFPKHQVKEVQQSLTQFIMEAGKPMMEKMKNVRRQRQGAIDTEENYNREQAQCPREMPLRRGRFNQ